MKVLSHQAARTFILVAEQCGSYSYDAKRYFLDIGTDILICQTHTVGPNSGSISKTFMALNQLM